jgi:hypothetical protein
MTISKQSWIYRAYVRALDLLDEFNLRDYQDREAREHTDLCRFMRVFLIWIPFMFLFQFAVLGAVVVAFVYLPIRYNGLRAYLEALAWVIGVIVGLLGIVYVCILLSEREPPLWLVEWLNRQRPEKLKKSPGPAKIIFTYIKAKKAKICPLVRFTE